MQQIPTWGNHNYRRNMNSEDPFDQFELLEQKVEKLIHFVDQLKAEKDSYAEQLQIQEEKIGDLAAEVERLKSSRNKAKQRVVSLLEKMEHLEL